MKSVLQAGWLLTNAFGNFIVLIVAKIAKLPKQVKTCHHKITATYDICTYFSIYLMPFPPLFALLKWTEYVLFASLLVSVCIIFSIMASFYTYIDPTEIEAQFRKKDHDDDDEDDKKKELEKSDLKMEKRDSFSSDDEDHKSAQTSMWDKAISPGLLKQK